MPERQGKIIQVKNQFPGTPTVWMSCVGVGIQRGINLCFQCEHFKPAEHGHCPIAQSLFDFSNKHNVSGPIVRCGHFKPKPGILHSNSGAYE